MSYLISCQHQTEVRETRTHFSHTFLPNGWKSVPWQGYNVPLKVWKKPLRQNVFSYAYLAGQNVLLKVRNTSAINMGPIWYDTIFADNWNLTTTTCEEASHHLLLHGAFRRYVGPVTNKTNKNKSNYVYVSLYNCSLADIGQKTLPQDKAVLPNRLSAERFSNFQIQLSPTLCLII